jgi:hypothetical protein
MRVALVKGRIDPESEATFAEGLTRKPPYYFFSQIILELEPACRNQGWGVDILSVGKPTPQRLRIPDVLVNLITEPLVCRRALDRLETIVRMNGLPIVNGVEAIRRSGRTALAGMIHESKAVNVRVPLTTRFSGGLEQLERHIEAHAHRWPVLLRPVGTHSSIGLTRVNSARRLRALDTVPKDLLVTDFVDFRSGDGLYRKYRMIWVDGTIFRRHVIAALDWNVTGKSRVDMAERPETIIAEKEFLASGSALDDRVAELFRIVGLDLGVIDFALSDAGEITVFELNGTFQISRSIPVKHLAEWGYLEANNTAIIDALVASIARRADRPFRPALDPSQGVTVKQ